MILTFDDNETRQSSPSLSTGPPRAVRILSLGADGAPLEDGLLVIEVGTRLVFSMKPNERVSMVSEIIIIATRKKEREKKRENGRRRGAFLYRLWKSDQET